ncbi:hypothetical protein FQR65_LT05489 [Abscondita terminalis]|nr:hypothetical protein FQR65_LT05489 [Abscondita terminalis]
MKVISDHSIFIYFYYIYGPSSAVCLLDSMCYTFCNGALASNVLAHKYLDTLYLLSVSMGIYRMRTHLAFFTLQGIFVKFDKASGYSNYISTAKGVRPQESSSVEETSFIEVRRDGTIAEWTVGGVLAGCLLDSTRYTFSNGALARNVLACKYLDILYLLCLLMDTHMTRIHLIASGLQRFFLKFDKASGDCYISTDGLKVEGIRPRGSSPLRSIEETYFIEVHQVGTIAEWTVNDRPLQISAFADYILKQALEELRAVFTSEIAHTAYISFLKRIGLNSQIGIEKSRIHQKFVSRVRTRDQINVSEHHTTLQL